MPRFHVQFTRQSTVIDRYGIDVEADSFEAALAKVESWGKGEIDLSDDEAATDTHEREVETADSEFLRVLEYQEQGNDEPIEEE